MPPYRQHWIDDHGAALGVMFAYAGHRERNLYGL